jgi:hypothetical protein
MIVQRFFPPILFVKPLDRRLRPRCSRVLSAAKTGGKNVVTFLNTNLGFDYPRDLNPPANRYFGRKLGSVINTVWEV